MLTRRLVLLGAGALAAGIRPVAGRAASLTLTAADVHVDGYPTVEAVRWMGRMLAHETGGRLVRALGANPTPLSYGEVYSSLQTHLIDGAENNWRTFHSSRQFEVARHWAQSEHSYSPEALFMSRRRFDALSGDDQELILTVATQSVPYMREFWDRAEAESRAVVIAAGVRVTDVPRCFSPRPPRTTCTAPSCRSTAVGSHARPQGQPSNARRRARLSAGQYLLRS